MTHDPYEAPEVSLPMAEPETKITERNGKPVIVLLNFGVPIAYLSEHFCHRAYLDLRDVRYAKDAAEAEREDRAALLEEMKAKAAK